MSEPTAHSSLADLLVDAGYVSPADAERASASTSRGGVLGVGLRLVLVGLLGDEELADFLAQTAGRPRLADDELIGCAEAFDALPFEIVYDSGVLPIRFTDARLVVGVLDPADSSAIEEAEFFAGLELDVRVLSLGQFASEFERASRVPWQVPSEELRSLRRPIGESRQELDQELRRLFASVSTSAAYPLTVEPVEEGAAEYELSSSGPVLRIEPVAADEDLSEVVELTPSDQAQTVAIADSDGPAATNASARSESVTAGRPSVAASAVKEGSGGLEIVNDTDGSVPVVEVTSSLSASPRANGGREPSPRSESVTAGRVSVGGAEVTQSSGGLEIVDEEAGSVPVVEVAQSQLRTTSLSVEIERLDASANVDEIIDLVPLRPRHEGADRLDEERHRSPTHDVEVVTVRSGSGSTPVPDNVNETLQLLDPAIQAELAPGLPSDRRRGDQETPARSLETAVASRRTEARTPATSVSAVLASETTASSTRLIDSAAGGLGRRVRPEARTTGPQAVVTTRPPGKTAEREARPTPRQVPTVGEFLGSEVAGRFGSLADIVESLGPADPATTAAVRLALDGLEDAEARDDVARELVESLSLVYPTVLVLRLKLPRLVVWAGVLSTGGASPVGQSLDVHEDGVWHRVARDRDVFIGTLPADGPLRRQMPRAISAETLVAPLQMGGRVVALLVLDAGATGQLGPPGAELRALCEGFEVALRRVIVKRKNAGRPV